MKLIFDIGANNGNTVEFYKNFSEVLVCFEPNPKLVEVLKNRFKNENVIIDNRGVSDSVEIKKFMLSNADTISTFSNNWVEESRFSKTHRWDESVDVQTTTLDSIINQYGEPDFVKIDVEGYEYEVLNGLTLLLHKSIFAFEWAEEQYERILKTISHLKSIGYNNFSFTYGDTPSLGNDLTYKNWEDLEINSNINVNRKEKWGMIYFKK
jgi:FkbM family methyltransferase